MLFIKKYNEKGLAFLLYKSGIYKTVKGAARTIRGGWIGKMTGLYEMLEKSIKDPNYIPKNGEVFGLFDGMLGTDEWYIVEDNKIKMIEG